MARLHYALDPNLPQSARHLPFDFVALPIAEQRCPERRQHRNAAGRYVCVRREREDVLRTFTARKVEHPHARLHGDDVRRDLRRMHDHRPLELGIQLTQMVLVAKRGFAAGAQQRAQPSRVDFRHDNGTLSHVILLSSLCGGCTWRP
jgi:hypothetical protein